MDDLQAVFGSSSRYTYQQQANQSPSAASFTSAASSSTSNRTATPRNNNYAAPLYTQSLPPAPPRDLMDDEDDEAGMLPRRQERGQDDVDIFPLADLLGPMGDDQKQFEQDLDADMRSFENTQSTFSERDVLDLGGNARRGRERPNLFSSGTETRRATSPVNSAFDPVPDTDRMMDNTMSSISSIEMGRSAPAQPLSRQASGQHRQHQSHPTTIPSLRVQPPSQPNRSQAPRNRDEWNDTHSQANNTKHVGASPTSTMGHHVSRLSNGLGPSGWMTQGGGHNEKGGKDWEKRDMSLEDEDEGGEEYDKDRSVRRLLDELQNAGRSGREKQRDKENDRPVASQSTRQPPADQAQGQVRSRGQASSQLNVFAPNATSTAIHSQHQQQGQGHGPNSAAAVTAYKPLRPSSLQNASQQNAGGRTISASSSAGGLAFGLAGIGAAHSNGNSRNLRAEQPAHSQQGPQGIFRSGGSDSANGGVNGNGYEYQDTPVPIRGRRSASNSLLVGGGAGDRENANRSTAKRVPLGSAGAQLSANQAQDQAQAPRVRVVSDPDAKARQVSQPSRPHAVRTKVSKSKDSAVGAHDVSMRKTEGWEAELTRLTDLCRTPGKGDSFVAVGPNAAAPGTGARIPKTLNDIHARMLALQDDCMRSKRRVQELEMELEQCRLEAGVIAREGKERHAQEVTEWRMRWQAVEREKEGLQQLLAAATAKIDDLERQQRHTVAEVASLREELKIRMTPRKARPVQRSGSSTDDATDLRPAMENVIKRLYTLECEVVELKGVVDEAIDWRQNAKAERSMVIDSQQAPKASRRGSKAAAYPNQYQDGLKTAAYDGAAMRGTTNKLHAIVESESENGNLSASPQPSLASRSMRRAETYMDSARKARSLRRHERRSLPTSPGNNSQGSAVSRSEDPQEDPSMEAFPAIRGKKLEEEFFASLGDTLVAGNGMRFAESAAPGARIEHKHERETGQDTAPRSPTEKLPAASHIMAVLTELEEDFRHYLGIYTELADQYKRMHPTNTKRNILAEHLKSVIDTMEGKANQVARLTEVLDASQHKPYRAPAIDKAVVEAARASKMRMTMPKGLDWIDRDARRSGGEKA